MIFSIVHCDFRKPDSTSTEKRKSKKVNPKSKCFGYMFSSFTFIQIEFALVSYCYVGLIIHTFFVWLLSSYFHILFAQKIHLSSIARIYKGVDFQMFAYRKGIGKLEKLFAYFWKPCSHLYRIKIRQKMKETSSTCSFRKRQKPIYVSKSDIDNHLIGLNVGLIYKDHTRIERFENIHNDFSIFFEIMLQSANFSETY